MLSLFVPVFGQQVHGTGPVKWMHLKAGIYVIFGAGSNITVQTGPDGVLLVNSGAPGMAEQVLAAVRQITDKPIRYLINTNGDPDSVGGNQAVAAAGKTIMGGNVVMERDGVSDMGATIIGHLNVQNRLLAKDGDRLAYPAAFWPTDVFDSRQKNIYFNGEPIELRHVPSAHTNGDLMVFFRGSDVIAAGNILDTEHYPVIDLDHGGNIEGILAGLNMLLDLTVVQRMAEGGTQVVPGRGRICYQSDVSIIQEMTTIIRDRVRDSIAKRKSLPQIQADKPTEDYDPRYAPPGSMPNPEVFVDTVYASLKPRM